MGDKKITTVYETKDYSRFKIIDGNRELDHVAKVKKSIEKVGYLYCPILVNEKWEIVEGQHRYTACKELGLPIMYVMQNGLSIKQVQALNTCAKQWNTKNHIHAYSTGALETPDYKYIEILVRKYSNFNAATIIAATSAYELRSDHINKVIDGELTCTAEDFQRGDKVLGYLQRVRGAIKENPKSICRALVYVFSLAIRREVLDPEYLVNKFIKHSGKMEFSTRTEANIAELEKLYNFRTQSEKRAYFTNWYKEEMLEVRRLSQEKSTKKRFYGEEVE